MRSGRRGPIKRGLSVLTAVALLDVAAAVTVAAVDRPGLAGHEVAWLDSATGHTWVMDGAGATPIDIGLPKLQAARFEWSPTGRSLLVQGGATLLQEESWRYDMVTGEVTPLACTGDCSQYHFSGDQLLRADPCSESLERLLPSEIAFDHVVEKGLPPVDPASTACSQPVVPDAQLAYRGGEIDADPVGGSDNPVAFDLYLLAPDGRARKLADLPTVGTGGSLLLAATSNADEVLATEIDGLDTGLVSHLSLVDLRTGHATKLRSPPRIADVSDAIESDPGLGDRAWYYRTPTGCRPHAASTCPPVATTEYRLVGTRWVATGRKGLGVVESADDQMRLDGFGHLAPGGSPDMKLSMDGHVLASHVEEASWNDVVLPQGDLLAGGTGGTTVLGDRVRSAVLATFAEPGLSFSMHGTAVSGAGGIALRGGGSMDPGRQASTMSFTGRLAGHTISYDLSSFARDNYLGFSVEGSLSVYLVTRRHWIEIPRTVPGGPADVLRLLSLPGSSALPLDSTGFVRPAGACYAVRLGASQWRAYLRDHYPKATVGVPPTVVVCLTSSGLVSRVRLGAHLSLLGAGSEYEFDLAPTTVHLGLTPPAATDTVSLAQFLRDLQKMEGGGSGGFDPAIF